MSEKFIFLSEGEINFIQNKDVTILNSSIADGYKKKIKEINTRNEWKKTGSGAMFMGAGRFDPSDYGQENEKLHINSAVKYDENKIAYTLNSGNVGGIYIKDVLNLDDPEAYVIVKEKMRFFDIDYVRGKSSIIVSVAESFLERHLALVDTEKRDFTLLTEGESYDCNPAWSRKDESVIYYDSCGLGYDTNQRFVKYGPKSVFRYNTATGDLSETLEGGKFDYYKPYEDNSGNLYYIKRPHNLDKSQAISFTDIVLMPVKILKGIFGWLNFFTQRYAGESLKTNGNNPAKTQQKSPEQIFIDGNLLEVEKNLKQNEALGEKNPGFAPSNWELITRKTSGEEKVIKKGVLDYCVSANGSILYSNGKYVLKISEEGVEEIIAKVRFADSLICFF